MAFQINITPEDVDALVRDSILKSGIGGRISKAVSDALGKTYDNPIDSAIKQHVVFVAQELIQKKYSEQIKAMIAKVIEERVTTELMQNTVNTVVERMARAAAERY